MEFLTIKTQYNYAEAWHFLQQKGIEVYGNKFQLHEQDKPPIYLMLCYFLQDHLAAPQLNIDLNKGILLTGPVGCGKTTLINLMKFFIQKQQQKFITKTCRDISFEFIEEGYSVIHRYAKLPSFGGAGGGCFCFDDLGTENSLKYFGNECNVMAEILLTRYDLFIAQKLITHLTTNLSASEIEEIYGNRVRSRFREMFNLIAFDKESEDKRK
jgi:energy-coupling factor transporter ATP-binding protein EcfA2